MADPLAIIDRILGELLQLRADLVAAGGKSDAGVEYGGQDPENDFRPECLLEISTACERFNRPADSIRWLCRKQACGMKVGGRWLASGPRLARWLNGGG